MNVDEVDEVEPDGVTVHNPWSRSRDVQRIVDCHWLPIRDGDPRAFALFRRHYSYRDYADGRRRDWSNPNRMMFVGPGEKMVLMTVNCDALFVWRKFISDDGQQGVNCAVFRNESDILSSTLILEAEQHAMRRWPGERLYTYVNPSAIRSSNPGYCYLRAGWRKCGKSQRGLIILEKRPATQYQGQWWGPLTPPWRE